MTDDEIATARATIERANGPTWITPSASSMLAGWSAALDEVEHLTQLHALAERAMHSAHEASKAFEAQAQRYFDAKEPLEVVADAARAFVAEFEACRNAHPAYEALRGALAAAPVDPEVSKLTAAVEADA